MQRLFFALLTCISISIFSCVSPHVLNKYAAEAREPQIPAFVIFKNGDTLYGNELKRRNKQWTLDGKPVEKSNIVAYQDEDGFVENGRVRIIKGKLSMFGYMQDNSTMQTVYNSSTKSYETKTSGGTQTTFYLKYPDGRIEGLSYNVLKNAVQDCPSAVKKLESEFAGTYTKNHPNWLTNHYPKLINVLEVYNSSCP